ncbi:MAG: type IX secretion system membrane protein PorP/SprF [Bacteroidota bacterium]
MKYIYIIFFFSLTMLMKAGDPYFTQFYAAPIYMNPAFTGLTYKHRIVTMYRNQWPGVNSAYKTYMVNYDAKLSAINSGFGIGILNDKSGTVGLTLTQFSANYAYFIKINKETEFRMGTNLSFNIKRLDLSKLKFYDQFVTGSNNSIEISNYREVNYMDFAAGVLLNSSKYWFGLSMKHLLKPKSTLKSIEDPLSITTSLHGGYRFIIEQSIRKDVKRYFSPSFNFRQQSNNNQLDVGIHYFHLPINIGIWYRGLPFKVNGSYKNNESIAVLFGIDITHNLRVGYSFDFTISKLGITNSIGAHEVSLKYEIGKEAKTEASCHEF